MSTVCEVLIGDDVTGELPFDPSAVSRYAGKVLDTCGIGDAQVNIVVIGDEAMTGINEAYRNKPGSTDVLSFNLSEQSDALLEGEIYISLDRVQVQAAEYGIAESEEFLRLVTHGLLHLCGRTHDTEEDYRSMTEETERLMAQYGTGGEDVS